MDLPILTWLQSPPGQTLLAELATHVLREADVLGVLTRLRRTYTPDQARSAVELTLLRQRASIKFPHAAQMFFTREALEQASAAPVATHRAQRLAPYAEVADLCCGLGGDCLALAAAGVQVTAVDRDPLRLALVRANADALGFASQVNVQQRDLLLEAPPPAAALFCDPGRRAGGRRRFAVEEYEPPLSHILAWTQQTPALGVKLAPGVDSSSLPNDIELEFVSLNGELKEATLWCGPLAKVVRRASVLHTSGNGQTQTYTMTTQQPTGTTCDIRAPGSFLYEPDPAIIRAGLVTQLATQIHATQLDPQIAYLSAEHQTHTPFARIWPIITWQPFGLKRLRASLRALGAGPITVKKRGSPLDTDTLARQLSGEGPQPLVVVLTQYDGKPISIICGPPVVE